MQLKKLDCLAGWIAAAGFAVFAAMVADSALAATSIKNSKHNLGSLGSGTVKTTSTDEVCVFCHTPHGGDTDKSAPLWNRGVNSAGAYTMYDGAWGDRPSTFDGKAANETLTVGSISLLCLSCHDGSTALDLLINKPGSGGYNASGASAGYSWTGGGTMPAGITQIGLDLRNDHPISVPYCGGRKLGSTFDATTSTAALTAADCRDGDFASTATPSNNLFWVDPVGVGTPNVREKTDMILYVRNFAGTSVAGQVTATGVWPSVECGSCHDPHNADSSSTTSPAFMRIANTGSQLCLTCHVK